MKSVIFSHEFFMKEALKEAQFAYDKDEVPVGAVIVANSTVVARAHNLTETLNDVTAHAEMQVITAATNLLGSKYLPGCTLYVTLEPCVMCAGALFWSQISEIVYAASDDKRGYSLINHPLLHPKTIITHGIMEREASHLITKFFSQKRKSPKM